MVVSPLGLTECSSDYEGIRNVSREGAAKMLSSRAGMRPGPSPSSRRRLLEPEA